MLEEIIGGLSAQHSEPHHNGRDGHDNQTADRRKNGQCRRFLKQRPQLFLPGRLFTIGCHDSFTFLFSVGKITRTKLFYTIFPRGANNTAKKRPAAQIFHLFFDMS